MGAKDDVQKLFQPTRPVKGATKVNEAVKQYLEFQPTRPVKGATRMSGGSTCEDDRFQPTRPVKGATRSRRCPESPSGSFNPRAP